MALAWSARAAPPDAGPPPKSADAGARLSDEDRELIEHLDLLQNMDMAKDLDMLRELSK
jgi:hypothetical protein